MPAPSHYILGSALARGLAEAGHDVTMISCYGETNPPKNGTYKDIVLTSVREEKDRMAKQNNFFDRESTGLLTNLMFLTFMGNKITDSTLSHPDVQELLNSKEAFDVIIIEQFVNDALKILQYHFNAPLIIFSPVGANRWVNDLVANPAPPSYVPEVVLSYSHEMSFFERARNFAVGLIWEALFQFWFLPQQNRIVQKHFPDAPPLEELLYNVSLILLNEHESTNYAIPHVPNMISVGGYHIKPPTRLPQDLQEFLDGAKEGVIYFSMGSNLIPSQMPQATKDALLSTLGSLKQKVLWKWDEENMPGLPDNFKISKWFPQQDILAHPNIKLFITHGGLLSTTETIYHGVPILAIPIFGDQKMNAKRAENLGFAVTLPFQQLTSGNLLNTLNKLLNNPKYKQNAKERSKILRDRPIEPLDLAVYWTEYVIRNKGATHLRVAGVNLPCMGSVLRSSDMTNEKRDIILKTFKKFNLNVLWKWEDEDLPNQPNNVKTAKWLPQSDILGHPNVKLFITHCGHGSFTESVYNGKPMVALPIFGDQPANALKVEEFGLGVTLSLADMTEESFTKAIKDVLETPKYSANAKHRSALYKDRQVKAIDEAIYWIEYVIRHNGATHLRVTYLDMPWYQYYLVDVAVFLSSIIVGVVLILKALWSRIWNKKNSNKKLKKN